MNTCELSTVVSGNYNKIQIIKTINLKCETSVDDFYFYFEWKSLNNWHFLHTGISNTTNINFELHGLRTIQTISNYIATMNQFSISQSLALHRKFCQQYRKNFFDSGLQWQWKIIWMPALISLNKFESSNHSA